VNAGLDLHDDIGTPGQDRGGLREIKNWVVRPTSNSNLIVHHNFYRADPGAKANKRRIVEAQRVEERHILHPLKDCPRRFEGALDRFPRA
jgi:hypothetical protein